MIEREPLQYGLSERMEYIAARLSYLNVPKNVIKKVLEADRDFIKLILQKGDKVSIPEFGVFSLRYVPAHEEKFVDNGFFGTGLTIPASEEFNRVKFKPYKAFTDFIKNSTYGNAFHKPLEENDDESEEEEYTNGEKTE